MSLVARYLEANGLPTVIIGSALDIVEHCGVPRFVFTDLPLGNPVGHPWDRAMQREVVRLALDTLAAASGPRTTVRAPVAASRASTRGDGLLTTPRSSLWRYAAEILAGPATAYSETPFFSRTFRSSFPSLANMNIY